MKNIAIGMLLTLMFAMLVMIYAHKRGLVEWPNSTKVRHLFELPQGEAMPCKSFVLEDCGITLKGCGWEDAETFTCLSDVHYVGPISK